MSVRTAILVVLFVLLAVVGLTSCVPPVEAARDPGAFARVCAEACGVGGVRRLAGAECECWPAVCSVDRLEVAPVPRGPDGRIRRGGGR